MSETTKKRSLNVVKFLREVRAELKKVMWPTRQQLVKHTTTVLIAIAIVAIFIGLIDFGLGKGLDAILKLAP